MSVRNTPVYVTAFTGFQEIYSSLEFSKTSKSFMKKFMEKMIGHGGATEVSKITLSIFLCQGPVAENHVPLVAGPFKEWLRQPFQ